MKIKFLVGNGAGEVRADQGIARKYYQVRVKKDTQDNKRPHPGARKEESGAKRRNSGESMPSLESVEELEIVILREGELEIIVWIGSHPLIKESLIKLLMEYDDVFAFSATDLVGKARKSPSIT